MWQAFIIFNLVDRPVSVAEKITHRVLTATDSAASALGGEAGKLIVLGGQLLPILATMLYLAVLVVMASVSYLLIEQPGEEWARQAGWTKEHPDAVSSYLT